jgi:hypothetical protein
MAIFNKKYTGIFSRDIQDLNDRAIYSSKCKSIFDECDFYSENNAQTNNCNLFLWLIFQIFFLEFII